jgi:hypothetical protein
MNLIEFNDLANYYRLNINISSIRNGETVVKPIQEYMNPDINDPLQRIFYLFCFISKGKIAICTQPKFYQILVSFIKTINNAESIYNNPDDICRIISKISNIPCEKINYGRNLLFLKNQENFNLNENLNIKKLTLNDIKDIKKLTNDNAFCCPIETVNKGFAFGYYIDSRLISIAYSISPKNPDIKDFAETIVIFTNEKDRRKGYAKLTLKFLIKEIIKNNKIIMYGCKDTNIGSKKVAESLGFTLMGNTIRFW